MAEYATVTDIQNLKRPLTAAEQTRAKYLITVASAEIQAEAKKCGRDFEKMLVQNPDLAEVAKAVVADVVMRELNTPAMQLPATSYSEGAGGINQSYSLPNASGSVKLWPSDIKALGLRRQKIGALDMRGEVTPCFRAFADRR
jgi:hypothetical protein